ncbi:MAG: magnesium chelatase, partial [Planctomycetes bacterium]|nr:magnesium chelatase [Planctomycetota bacterium]
SVIRTHYPRTLEEAMEITRQNAWLQRDGEVRVQVPKFLHEIVEEFVRLARVSPHVNPASGVSVRCSLANVENLVSSAERRGIVHGENPVVARMDDLAFLPAGCRGKIELMLAEGEAAEDKLIVALLGEAVKLVFGRYAQVDTYEEIIQQFQGGLTLQVGDDVPTPTLAANYQHLKGLPAAAGKLAAKLGLSADDPAAVVSAGEFILEALYVHNRLSKVVARQKTFFRK